MNVANKYDILSDYHNEYDTTTSGNTKGQFNRGTKVKGLTNMNHRSNLSDYALDLVSNYAKFSCDQLELSLNTLPDDEQSELARLFMEFSGRETSECVYGHDFSIESEYTCALLSLLQSDCQETRDRFAEVTRKNIILYYAQSLQETLDNACEFYLQASNNENGLYAYQDPEHGDTLWGGL